MAASPWHPRIVPFFVYILGLMVTGFINDAVPYARPITYALVAVIIVFLLWRYRKLTPELTLKFHWLAIPTGIGLLYAWVYLGYATVWAAHQTQGTPVLGPIADFFVSTDYPLWQEATPARTDSAIWRGKAAFGDTWYWTTMSFRLLGMTLMVPLFEELFVRSAVLRSCFNFKKTRTGILQVLGDMPVIGEAIANSRAGKAADQEPAAFSEQLNTTQVGRVSLFCIIASTVVFMLSHAPRDWAGCIACGVVWCLLLWWTNRPRAGKGEAWESMPEGGRMGLGPIAWSHGITNAALWAWTLKVGDWQFL